MKKRALCALLAVLLWVSLLPLPAMAADTVAINETNFPDPNFRSWLQSEYGDPAVISQVTEIDVYNNSISDLTGIEHFTGLIYLYCDFNQLTSLDVSKNTGLIILSCGDNQLTSLDVSKNTGLTRLYCFNNQLTSLDVSKNSELKYLYCDKNQLTSLDISRNPHLLEAYIKGEKQEYGIYTRYSVSGKVLHVDPDVKIVCLSVTAQPKSQTAEAGKKATFSVEADGYELQYQWYVQKKGESAWTELTGETKQELTVTAAEELDGSRYRCAVTGAGREETLTLTSKEATLTLKTEPEAPVKPRITSQPKSKTVTAGKKVTFKVKATGGNLKYQWYVKKTGSKKWVKVKKATKPTLKFKATAKMNGYRYRCKVYNEAGYKYSRTVKLKVKKK